MAAHARHRRLEIPDLLQRARVVVHCRGGIGRSGLVAASVATTYGLTPAEAIARVRPSQPLAVETRLQEAYVGQDSERVAAPGQGPR